LTAGKGKAVNKKNKLTVNDPADNEPKVVSVLLKEKKKLTTGSLLTAGSLSGSGSSRASA